LKVKIEDFCIRCGICITLYPELYKMDLNRDVVLLKIDEIPETLTEKAKLSMKDCAVTAIHLNQ
jgi:ferredoxin